VDLGAGRVEAVERAGAGDACRKRPTGRSDAGWDKLPANGICGGRNGTQFEPQIKVDAMDGKLTELVSRLKEAAGKNLESVILYGSGARGDYKPGTSDLNVLCTLVDLSFGELQQLAPVVAWWTQEQKEPAPLFFLTEELRQSTDVFAVESLDVQRSHKVLYGKDVVENLEIPMNLHRVEVEHELRLLLQRLRQHVLLVGRNELELNAILNKTISGVVTLLRHTLLAFGEEPPAAPKDIFAKIGEITGADPEAFEEVYAHRETNAWTKDTFTAYGDYLHALEKVVVALDGLVPKKEWQRVQKQASGS
jgi:hypothetical protein